MIIIEDDICFECGSSEMIQKHHVIPKVKGGTKTVPLCQLCHGKVHGDHMLKIQKLAQEAIAKKRKMIKELGLENNFGRPAGTKETTDIFLSKPKTKQITELLKQGLTYNEIQSVTYCSPKTISKVRKNSGITRKEYESYKNMAKREKKKIYVVCVRGNYAGQIRSMEEWESILKIKKGCITSHIHGNRYKNGINGNVFKFESNCTENVQLAFMLDV